MVGSYIDITRRKQAEETLRHRESQLRSAQRIQEHLLPDEPPDIPGLDIAGALHPAEFAAGDLFDFIRLSAESIAIVIGDVSGHGIGPALLMASTHDRIHTLAELGFDIDEILARTNSALYDQTEEGRFVTLLLARIDPVKQSLIYTNAGHPAGVILDQAGTVKARLESTSFPLGILPDARFPKGDPIPLCPGDRLLLVTDGVKETTSPEGELFGTDRAIRIVRDGNGSSAREIVDAIYHEIRAFSGAEHHPDDVTIVVVRVEPDFESRYTRSSRISTKSGR
jgi:serine phosphatase RsbU (regulator of sigma subunit)